MTQVAALYIDPRGPYPQLLTDCWDEKRDARNYAGPNPVVAHPPCGPYCKTRHLYKGAEHDCALRAVEQVRKFGGVLEHPKDSRLWSVAGLPRPGELPDAWGGATVLVNQVDFGHVARKPTWVYMVGVPSSALWFPPKREPTHWCGGGRTRSSRRGSPIPVGIKAASSPQKRRTPVVFAVWLISLAAQARRS